MDLKDAGDMTDQSKAEPLHNLLRKMRNPVTLRELMAACLRSIYMGDPFSDYGEVLKTPADLLQQVKVIDQTISGVRCAVYTPAEATLAAQIVGAPEEKKCPLLLYMHGGGFVIGCSEDTDYVTRRLCQRLQAIVVSVNYRLAPETSFPGALDDCEKVLYAVIGGALELPPDLNGAMDTSSLYVAGDSAGGNLAAALAYRLNQSQKPAQGVILFAPWLDMQLEAYDSYNQLAPAGIVFDAAFLGYARAAYVGYEKWTDPLVSPLFIALQSLPPTIIVIGTADPLVDQTLKLKQMAHECSAEQIEILTYSDLPHCFYSFPNLFAEEEDCYRRIADFVEALRSP